MYVSGGKTPMSHGEGNEPRTLQERILYLLERSFPEGTPSDREFCRIVESRGHALSHSYFGKLRKGQITEVRDETMQALAAGFGVDWRYFKGAPQVEAEVIAGLKFLAETKSGTITGVAGRGIGDAGLPSDLLQLALGLVAKEKARRAEQAPEATEN